MILGAAGRDFHDFNVVYRDDPSVTVVAFTATQIPGIGRRCCRLRGRGARGVRAASRRRECRFAGVDYGEIGRRAAAEADVIVWDGGNNDFPFFRPTLSIVVADALRPEDAAGYHPGEAVLRTADIVVLNKVDAATSAQVTRAIEVIRTVNSTAPLVRAASPVQLDDPAAVRGRRVLVVEDGPTLTHGSMSHGAGFVAARAAGATVVDPRPSAAPEILELLARYPTSGRCCRRSDTARGSSRLCGRRSTVRLSMSSSPRRRSTSPASCHRTNRWFVHGTSSRRRENRGCGT